MTHNTILTSAWQVHSGLIALHGWTQLLRKRVSSNKVDIQQTIGALRRLEALTKDTERKLTELTSQFTHETQPGVAPAGTSAIHALSYGHGAPVLTVRFQDHSVYTYYDVPSEIHDGLVAAEAQGEYFDSHIRDHYPYKRVTAG